jgi:UDP-N-acetylglucosamine--N-acetylmuramyl-(pentapeptide) pyrophosphoryl-undecaprenol N-acetylglucosamine transferase
MPNGDRAERAVHLACSPGGHLDLLVALRGALGDARRAWVTVPGARARELAQEGERVRLVPLYGRSPLRALANLRAALGIVLRDRPRLVVSSGAGVVVPFCLLARLFGARLVFVETMARVDALSMAGRLLSRVADRVLVQWPELSASVPRATVCRPILLEAIGEPAQAGAGTLVALGTHHEPFDRLVGAVLDAVRGGRLGEPVLIQAGSTPVADGRARVVEFLARDELAAACRDAEVVVAHAGAGIIATALRAGRRPIVMARRVAFGEHVDDHQLEITRKLGELGLVVHVESRIAEEDAARARVAPEVPPELLVLPGLAEALSAAVAEVG